METERREHPQPLDPKVRRLANVSQWLGILSFLVCLGPLASVPGLILAHVAKRKSGQPSLETTPPRIRIALFLNYANLVVVVVVALAWWCLLGPLREISCANNLFYPCSIFLSEYAADNPGHLLPELAPEKGRLMFADLGPCPTLVYPRYLHDLRVLLCPESSKDIPKADQWTDPAVCLDDYSYFYLGYAITNDVEMKAFADVYKDRVSKGLRFDTDLEVTPGTGTAGGDRLLRLRRDTEQASADPTADARTLSKLSRSIPIIWDRCATEVGQQPEKWFNHRKCFSVVLFLDGHIEWIKYPGKWPMTETAVELLTELDSLSPTKE